MVRTNKTIDDYMSSQLSSKQMNEEQLRHLAQRLRQELLEARTHEIYMRKVAD